MKRWDADWERLRLETKVNRLRDRLNNCYKDSIEQSYRAKARADTALYVANLNR